MIFSVIFTLLFSSFSVGSAYAAHIIDCEGVLIESPQYKKSPSLKQLTSLYRNAFALGWYREYLHEVQISAVRNQCYGTCYLESSHYSVETQLKAQGILAPNAFMSGYVTTMKTAWIRYQRTKATDLKVLLKGGFFDGFQTPTQGANYYLDENQVRLAGGAQRVASLEYSLLLEINSLSLELHRKKIKRLLKMPFSQFIAEIRANQEQALSKLAGTPIRMHEFKIKEIYFEAIVQVDLEKNGKRTYTEPYRASKYSEHSFYRNYPETVKNLNIAFFSRTELKDEFNEVFARFKRAIDKGQAVYVAINKLFGDRNSLNAHAIILTGYATDKNNKLRGFKALNSWGPRSSANGYLFIDPNTLYTHFDEAAIIEKIVIE